MSFAITGKIGRTVIQKRRKQWNPSESANYRVYIWISVHSALLFSHVFCAFLSLYVSQGRSLCSAVAQVEPKLWLFRHIINYGTLAFHVCGRESFTACPSPPTPTMNLNLIPNPSPSITSVRSARPHVNRDGRRRKRPRKGPELIYPLELPEGISSSQQGVWAEEMADKSLCGRSTGEGHLHGGGGEKKQKWSIAVYLEWPVMILTIE